MAVPSMASIAMASPRECACCRRSVKMSETRFNIAIQARNRSLFLAVGRDRQPQRGEPSVPGAHRPVQCRSISSIERCPSNKHVKDAPEVHSRPEFRRCMHAARAKCQMARPPALHLLGTQAPVPPPNWPLWSFRLFRSSPWRYSSFAPRSNRACGLNPSSWTKIQRQVTSLCCIDGRSPLSPWRCCFRT